jgi:hypothetical protein
MDRRSYIATLAAGAVGGLAGCSVLAGDSAVTPAATPTPTPAPAAPSVPRPEELSLPLPESAFVRAAPRDGIPAVVDPVFGEDWSGLTVTASDLLRENYTVEPRLRDWDRVIGVARGDEARAYPLKLLNWHEAVNDEFGGPLLVTFCPLCSSGIVARPVVEDEPTLFGVSGLLWRDDLVLYDAATGSLWSQLLATAVRGPATGVTLELVPSSLTTWGDWREAHPDTRVLRPPPDSNTVRGRVTYNYQRDRYGVYKVSEGVGPTEREFEDDRLHPKTQVIGVVRNGVARAYPVTVVAENEVINDAVGGEPVVVAAVPGTDNFVDGVLGAYGRRVDGEVLRFRPAEGPFMRAGGSRWRVSTGEAVDGPHAGRRLDQASHASQLFWFAWLEFYPDTTVYGPTGSR